MTRVGILSIANPQKGLWRDTECMLSALPSASVFGVRAYADQRATRSPHPAAVPAKTLLKDWLGTIDVMIVGEVLVPQTLQAALDAGVRVVYIPNLDWAKLGASVGAWAAWLREHPDVVVIAKSKQVQTCLAEHDIPSTLVPWSIPDDVVRDRPVPPEATRFYMNAGLGGWQDRRGVDIAVKAWRIVQAECPDATFTLKTIRPAKEYKIDLRGINVLEGMLPRRALTEKYQDVDVLLYPSRWEGFGLSLLEALHAGLPAIATDGWPMNEMVEHEHNGLLVHADRGEDVRLAPRWECDVQAMADAMIRIAKDHDLRRRLTCPQPGELVARNGAFGRRFRAAVEGKDLPACMVVYGTNPPGNSVRRSPDYWVDSLRSHGYDVLTSVENSKDMRRIAAQDLEFILVGKASKSCLRSIRSVTTTPVVMWHHDWVDYMPSRRTWADSVQPYLALYISPEPPSVVSGEARQLLPACRLDTDRGPGKRSRGTLPFPDDIPKAVFFGNHLAGNRGAHLATAARTVPTDVHGGIGRGPWTSKRPTGETSAAVVTRRYWATLSVSATCTRPGCTSIRLFNASGAGGAVLAEQFGGLDDLYPEGCVVAFEDADGLRRALGEVFEDADKRLSLRRNAEEWTYRHHTWDDRVADLLRHVGELS